MLATHAHAILRHTRHWGTGRRYLAATGLVALAAAIRWLLDPWMEGANYFLFVLTVALCSLLLERGSGIWASVLSALAVTYVFIPPQFSFAIDRAETVPLVLFLLSCALVTLAAEMVRSLTDRLDASNHQRDVLYRELHHRTRNNFQIIGTTIAMLMYRTSNPEVRASLQVVSDRIDGIVRLNQYLYRPGAGETIDSRDYLQSLTRDISTSLAGLRPVSMACHAEAHPLDRDLAEILGIAVNELVTNVLKYAFPDDRSGSITITFQLEDGTYALSVRDDGQGYDGEAKNGTGWQLIATMVGKYKGSLTAEDAAPGCRVMIRVPVPDKTA